MTKYEAVILNKVKDLML